MLTTRRSGPGTSRAWATYSVPRKDFPMATITSLIGLFFSERETASSNFCLQRVSSSSQEKLRNAVTAGMDEESDKRKSRRFMENWFLSFFSPPSAPPPPQRRHGGTEICSVIVLCRCRVWL